MKSCSILESQKRNKYFYDRKKKKAQLCHPLLYYFIAKARDAGDGAIDIKDRLSGLKDGESVEIEDYGCFSKKEIQYYYQKYMFLKQSDYFSEINQEELLSARVTGEDIEKVVANCPQVVFEVTEQCQMNCDYCGYGEFYHTVGRDERKSMDTGYAKTMLDYLLEKWNSPLNASHDSDIRIGFYGGEPLLNMPFIREIIDYTKGLKLLHNHFIYTMTTNGLLLDKHMDLLVENDFHLLISLDGDEANNAYRVFKNGKPTYDNIMKNIKALQMKSPRYFRDRVNFNVVLHNKNSVAAVYNFFKREFGIIPIIGELNTAGIKDSQKKTFWKTYANVYDSLRQSEDYSLIEKDMFLKAPGVQGVSRFLAYQNDSSFDRYRELVANVDTPQRIPTGTCFPFSKKIFVTATGGLLPCERIGYQHAPGTVDGEKVELDFDAIAEKYNAYYDKLRKQCNVCSNAETCVQCIFNLDIEDDNPVCNGFMTDKEYAGDIAQSVNYIEENPESYSRILKEAIVE